MSNIGKARLYVESPLGEGMNLAFDEGQSRYLSRVLRGASGDSVTLFNGRDGEWTAELTEVGKQASARCLALRRAQQLPPDHWLIFAPIKGDRVDGICEKATELGARAIGTVKTARTVVSRVNEDRLRATAIEAAEQTERLDVPEILPFRPLEQILAEWNPERLLILCDETGRGGPPDVALPPHRGRPAALLIGPEGGFGPQELARLSPLPYVIPMSLGPRVLRADTAAIAALTCLQLFLGDWADKPSFASA